VAGPSSQPQTMGAANLLPVLFPPTLFFSYDFFKIYLPQFIRK